LEKTIDDFSKAPKVDLTKLGSEIEKNLLKVENKLVAAKFEVSKFKSKVDTVMEEMLEINERLERNEQVIKDINMNEEALY
jgi:hypothetical protein